MIKWIRNITKGHWNKAAFLASVAMGFIVALTYWEDILENPLVGLLAGGGFGVFLIYPLVLTLMNVVLLFRKVEKTSRTTERITILLGIMYTLLYMALIEGLTGMVQYRADWQEVLFADQLHTPVWTEAWLTVGVLSGVGILGYLLLSLRDINRMPPLITVSAIAAVYIGMMVCGLWIAQVFPREFMLCLLPLNCILIGIKTIRNTVQEWQGDSGNQEKQFQWQWLNRLNGLLMNSAHWPVAGLILMVPLLGILVAVLVLFGQQPDSVIQAWTETADWNLSQRTAPPNLAYDEHYLCTVAAQGHPKVVKPLRKGMRHGHEVTVNRQLCIANAFEQVLEERLPRLHRGVRRFYDTYGFPVARLIRTEYAADVVYVLMKPLEWIFLVVLYLVDVEPENRIAVQYPHSPLQNRKL